MVIAVGRSPLGLDSHRKFLDQFLSVVGLALSKEMPPIEAVSVAPPPPLYLVPRLPIEVIPTADPMSGYFILGVATVGIIGAGLYYYFSHRDDPKRELIVSPALPPLVFKPIVIESEKSSQKKFDWKTILDGRRTALTSEAVRSLLVFMAQVDDDLSSREKKQMKPLDFWLKVWALLPDSLKVFSILELAHAATGPAHPKLRQWLVGRFSLFREAVLKEEAAHPSVMDVFEMRTMVFRTLKVSLKSAGYSAWANRWMDEDEVAATDREEIEDIWRRHDPRFRKQSKVSYHSLMEAGRRVAKRLKKEQVTIDRRAFKERVAAELGYASFYGTKNFIAHYEPKADWSAWEEIVAQFPEPIRHRNHYDIGREYYQKVVAAFEETDRWGEAEGENSYALKLDRVASRIGTSKPLSYTVQRIIRSNFDFQPIKTILEKWKVPPHLYQ